jgi:hypothetical protein
VSQLDQYSGEVRGVRQQVPLLNMDACIGGGKTRYLPVLNVFLNKIKITGKEKKIYQNLITKLENPFSFKLAKMFSKSLNVNV